MLKSQKRGGTATGLLKLFLATLILLSPKAATTSKRYSEKEAGLLAQLICAECKGCPRSERVAVGHVAKNRSESPGWWGWNLVTVIYAPGQFADTKSPLCHDALPDPPPPHKAWSPGMVSIHRNLMSSIRSDAVGILTGDVPDLSKGSMYFHAKRLGTIWPHKTTKEVEVPSNWHHRFFR